MRMRKSFVAGFAVLVFFSFGFSLAALAQKEERITDGPRVNRTTETSAEIAWSTTAPGSSIVRYGTRPDALTELAEKPWGGTREPNGDYNHTVWVKNLQPNTRYFFVVVTGQGKGTGTGSMSQVQEFRTAVR